MNSISLMPASSNRIQASEYVRAGFLFGFAAGLGVAGLILGATVWVCTIIAIAGFASWAILALFIGKDVPDSCALCGGKGITIYAGDVDRDDGYCELRNCPECGDGKRIGRSDVPIVSDYNPDHPHLRRVK